MHKKLFYLFTIAAFALICSCKKTAQQPVLNNTNPPTSGKYLLFDADETFNAGLTPIPSLYTSVYYCNLDGTHITQITALESGYYSYRASWSPNGKQVIFTRGNQDDSERSLCIIDIGGTNRKSVVSGDKVDYGSFSPDGTKIVYAKSLANTLPFPYDIYVANADGTAELQLTNFGPDNGAVSDIHWASDGKIYFYAGSDHNKTGIYSINPDGSNLKYIMTDVYLLNITPDAKHILFDLGDGIYVCDIDGSNIKKIVKYDNTNENMLVGASYSTDGGQLFFSNANYPTDFGIFRMNSDGSGIIKILNGYYEFPSVF